jgi:uncharacterized protein (UPF0276 family)
MCEGIGLGLRSPIAAPLFDGSAPPALRWLEIHPENYLGSLAYGGSVQFEARGGRYASLLAQARERYPLLTHGLTMGFGALAPFDPGYLRALRALLQELRAPWHSDHLCFSQVDEVYLHDLLPLPLHEEAIGVAVQRIQEAQDALGVAIAVEPISWYVRPPDSPLDEAEFISEILRRADAKLLLDVNNVYVNALNHGFDARGFIDKLPLARVVQLHMAGHHVRADGQRIDTHAAPISEPVYELFDYTMRKLARPLPVLLERDDAFPPFEELAAELTRLDVIYRRALAEQADHRALADRPRALP